MFIECTLRREEPIEVTIGRDTYTFKPDEKGRPVTEVYKEDHVAMFLACSHLYRDRDAAPAAPPTKRADIMAALRERGIVFNATTKTEDLRALLAQPAQAE